MWVPDVLFVGDQYQLGQLPDGAQCKVLRTSEFVTVLGKSHLPRCKHVRCGSEQKSMSIQLPVLLVALPERNRKERARYNTDRLLYSRVVSGLIYTLSCGVPIQKHRHVDVEFSKHFSGMQPDDLYRITLRYIPELGPAVAVSAAGYQNDFVEPVVKVPAFAVPLTTFINNVSGYMKENLSHHNVEIEYLDTFLTKIHLHRVLDLDFKISQTGRHKRITLRFGESERILNIQRALAHKTPKGTHNGTVS